MNRKKIENRALRLMEALLKNGISASIQEESFREFSVKIEVGEAEKASLLLYYSPKKDSFTIHYQEIKNKELAEKIRQVLEQSPTPAEKQKPQMNNSQIIDVYVDGSFFEGRVGYGAVVLKSGSVIHEICGSMDNPKVIESRQVGGELKATTEAIKWCLSQGIEEINLYYDYEGVAKWARGEWKANIHLTKKYKEFFKDKNIKIHWHKVKSHSGNKWNDKADALAKKGIKS
ncbi:MAG: hypothetical protein H7A25_22055 [Leptospiraceae bacterium]|nr:hypothetical protein [Leptospiraceae bacterium]MCP5502598.1 hypothetical protein [Leptospiraceae bacterium]